MDNSLFPIEGKDWAKGRLSFRGGEYCYRRNLICGINISPDNTLPSKVVAHEFTHFIQHCSTPYGLFLDELNFQRVALAQEFLKQCPGKIYTPVYKWARRDWGSPGDLSETNDPHLFAEMKSKLVRPWSATVFLEDILEGRSMTTVRESTIEKALIAMQICERELGKGPANEDAQIPWSKFGAQQPSDPSCPMVPFAETESGPTTIVPFGALHLAEAIALCVEGFESAFGSARPSDYLLAMGLLANRLEGSTDRPSTHAYVTPTLLGLCDLALFTPLGRVYAPLRHADLAWSDLHPGHRFIRCLDSVARRNAWIESLDEMERLAIDVCSEMNWPSPREFLEIGASLEHPYFRRHRDACVVRKQDYAIYKADQLSDGASAMSHLLANNMPMTSYGDYGTICGFPDQTNGAETPLKQVRECFINQLTWNVMGDEAGIEGEFFPPDLRFDLYFTNITGLDDFWQLFSENHQWCDRSRFVICE